MVTKMDDEGLKMLMKFEGVRNKMYKDTKGLPTIGVGHLIKDSEKHLLTAVLTDEEVMKLLKEDVKEAEKYAVNLFGSKLSQKCFSVCCSFIFNVGYGQAKKSEFKRLCSEGKYKEAAEALRKYGGDKRVKGLAIRRNEEADIFLEGLK